MTDDDKPLSTLVAQGWEVVAFSASMDNGVAVDNILLRKQRTHKILKIRPKYVGKGFVVKELDV